MKMIFKQAQQVLNDEISYMESKSYLSSNLVSPDKENWYGMVNGKLFKTNEGKIFFESAAAVKKAMKTSTLFSCIYSEIFTRIFHEKYSNVKENGCWETHAWEVDHKAEDKLARKEFNELFNILVENKSIEFKKIEYEF